jgi:SAM-dependent methyltransferase
MESFDAGWLALREPVDQRSRASELLQPLRAWWSARAGSEVLDLGSGTGSNLRYLAPHLPGIHRWTVVDHDESLLARVRAPDGVSVRALQHDLAGARLPEIRDSDLVTASALLDLVSERWLAALIEACAAAGSAMLFALTYDGRIEWSDDPDGRDADDALARDAVNAHQLRDKGFGPALGPAASEVAERLLREHGYRTRSCTSDWVLAPSDAALAEALVDGWEHAALEQCPAHADRLRAWGARRRGAVARGHVVLRVGHRDVLALPAEESSR